MSLLGNLSSWHGTWPWQKTEESKTQTKTKKFVVLDTPNNIIETFSDANFNSSKRRIDYVIVFKKPNGTVDPYLEQKLKTWRVNFTEGLLQQGLQLETTDGKSKQCADFSFIKVHVPWSALTHFADIMAIRKPLLPSEVNKIKSKRGFFWNWVKRSEEIKVSITKRKTLYTAPFSCARQDQFLIEDKDTFFTAAERSMIVHYILNRTVFGRHTSTGNPRFGLNELIHKGVISAAYPLHSSKLEDIFDNSYIFDYAWEYLMEKYGKCSQRLDLVKTYFGEKIAFFTTWQIFYTNMLIPVAVVGLGVTSFGLANLGSNKLIKDVCDITGAGNYSLCESSYPCNKCPGVNICPPRTLAESYCHTAILYLNTIFNNEATILNAVFVTLWMFIFLKLWTRRQAVLQTEWHVRDYEKEEVLRAQFYTLKGERRPHPITDNPEPFITFKEKCLRRMASIAMIVLIIGIKIAVTFATREFSQFLNCELDHLSKLNVKIINVTLISFLSLIFVMIFEKIYVYLCTPLTDFEMHRTESEWIDSFRLKYFIFCFMNYNMAPLTNVLLSIVYYEGLEAQDAIEYGLDIAMLLTFYMVGKPMMTYVIDRITSNQTIRYHVCGIKKSVVFGEKGKSDVPRYEKEFALNPVPNYYVTKFCSEMMIQYGLVTMYAAVYPLAATCAVIRNVLMMRSHVRQYTRYFRRPVAERIQGIGIYIDILKFISYLSIVTNAIVIVFQTQLVTYIVHITYEKSSERYVEFLLQKRDNGLNGTCRSYYRRTHGDTSCQATCWHSRHDNVRILLGLSFVLVSVVFAKMIDLIPNIPKAQDIELHKESYYAEKVLRMFLIRGVATKEFMREEENQRKKRSLFVRDNEETVTDEHNSSTVSTDMLRLSNVTVLTSSTAVAVLQEEEENHIISS